LILLLGDFVIFCFSLFKFEIKVYLTGLIFFWGLDIYDWIFVDFFNGDFRIGDLDYNLLYE